MCEIKNSKQVELSDRVRFRCMRCAACCRHVENSVVIEVKDAFYLAKHLGISVVDFYTTYTNMLTLENTGFPIFFLKTMGKDKSCIFLNGKRCSVQDAKPRTCKMYPFWVAPDDDGKTLSYNFSTERRHHPRGSLVKVKDWMREYLSDEDKEFILEDARSVMQIARPFRILYGNLKDPEDIQKRVLMYRYFFYDTNESFMEQFCRNNRVLEEELERIINKFTSI